MKIIHKIFQMKRVSELHKKKDKDQKDKVNLKYYLLYFNNLY